MVWLGRLPAEGRRAMLCPGSAPSIGKSQRCCPRHPCLWLQDAADVVLGAATSATAAALATELVQAEVCPASACAAAGRITNSEGALPCLASQDNER